MYASCCIRKVHMMSNASTAWVHSIQSLGAVDGPGIRCVVFFQGCPYHCPYCHNPDTQPREGGEAYTVDTLISRVSRFKSYFGETGGVTVSGGEPLLQKEFLAQFFAACHENGINTCLDTAGMYPDDGVRAVLKHTDTVLCDIKHPDRETGRKAFGVDLDATRAFLCACADTGCRVRIRHVVVPGMTDSEDNIRAVSALAHTVKTLDKIELLPFRTLCVEKYERLGIPFPLDGVPDCEKAVIERLKTFTE